MPEEIITKLFPQAKGQSHDVTYQKYGLTEKERIFYLEQVILNPEEAANLCNLTIGQSTSSAWRSARKVRITASRADGIFRATKDHTRLSNFNGAKVDGNKKDNLKNLKFGLEKEPIGEYNGSFVCYCFEICRNVC